MIFGCQAEVFQFPHHRQYLSVVRNFRMKTLLIILVLLSLQYSSAGQFDFPNDTSFHPFLQTRYNKIDSMFHLIRNNDFELRFWSTYGKNSGWSLFILSYKDSTWSARWFEQTMKGKNVLIEKAISNNSPGKLWKQLTKQNVLTLANSTELKDTTGKDADLPIVCGSSYFINLITPNKKRSYYYSCPKAHSEGYPYIKEFRQIVTIIEMIYKYVGLPTYYLC